MTTQVVRNLTRAFDVKKGRRHKDSLKKGGCVRYGPKDLKRCVMSSKVFSKGLCVYEAVMIR